jgi:hypothetical protein
VSALSGWKRSQPHAISIAMARTWRCLPCDALLPVASPPGRVGGGPRGPPPRRLGTAASRRTPSRRARRYSSRRPAA